MSGTAAAGASPRCRTSSASSVAPQRVARHVANLTRVSGTNKGMDDRNVVCRPSGMVLTDVRVSGDQTTDSRSVTPTWAVVGSWLIKAIFFPDLSSFIKKVVLVFSENL